MRKNMLLVAIALMAAFPTQAQGDRTLDLRGLNGQQRIVRDAELASMPRREVSASAHNIRGTYSGVALNDLLRLVGAPAGDSLRGPALATYILVEARDGYRVTFALAETNASFTDKLILLADRKDGAALAERDGPLQLIVPDEKRPGRWVRQVARISLVQPPAASRP